MKKHVLVIKELFSGGDVESGIISIGQSTVVETLQQFDKVESSFIFPDARQIWTKKGTKLKYVHNEIIPSYCIQEKVDAIVYDPVRRVLEEPNPDRVILAYIAWNLHIPIGAIAWDMGPASIHMYDKYLPMVSYICASDNMDPSQYTSNRKKWSSDFWYAANRKRLYDDGRTRHINVSLPGQAIGENPRTLLIREMKTRGIEVLTTDSQHNKMPTDTFFDVHRSSKIVISETSSGRLKWRPFEAIACGALLLEPASSCLNKYFIPDKEYVTYDTSPATETWDATIVNYDDLAEKIRYYISHEEERVAIASAGYNKLWSDFNSDTWWNKYLTEMGVL